jgi:NDP-sugar pyrophosphorylase family protein
MQCAILAGGLATRLGALTADVPKALLPVAGRPFADHQLAWLARDGVTDVVYCIAHLGDRIRAHVGDGARYGLRVTYVDEGSELRGTGGALRLAYDEGALADSFAVLYGDSYLPVDVGGVVRDFERRRPDVLMTVFRNDGRLDRSNAALAPDGRVRYDKAVADPEAAGMRYIDYGLAVIDRDRVLPEVPSGERVDLADVYARLSAEGRVHGHEVAERFYEIGSQEGLAELEHHLGAAEAGASL